MCLQVFSFSIPMTQSFELRPQLHTGGLNGMMQASCGMGGRFIWVPYGRRQTLRFPSGAAVLSGVARFRSSHSPGLCVPPVKGRFDTHIHRLIPAT